MSWLKKEALDPMGVEFKEAKRLLGVEDNQDRPYDSKYEARNILLKIQHQITEQHESCDHSRALLSHLHCQIGCIDIEVEEHSNGEKNLVKALELAQQVDSLDLVIAAKLKTWNQLGVLWCLREDYEKASEYLEKSLDCFNSFVQGSISNEKRVFETEDLFKDEETLKLNPPFYHLKTTVLDQLTIYTYYYLAQTYEKLDKKEKASECLHITLNKQIQLNDYDPLDWSRNASMLSIYYMAQDNYVTARHLLSGANHVFEEWKKKIDDQPELNEDLIEKGNKCKADIARTLGKYCHLLLQTSVERKYSGETEAPPDSNRFGDFFSLGFEDLDVPNVPAENFEDARNIFLPGKKFYSEAKEFYTFENHCVDFTEINQDLSRMYRSLIVFETDFDRKFQMFRRSAQLLEDPYKDLNPQPYLLINRQLAFELGEIYFAMADLKLQKFNSRTGQEEEHNPLTQNINKLVGLSQFSFLAFLGTLQTEEGKFPETFSEDTCRPALLAMLNLARMADKIVVFPVMSREKLGQVLEAFKYYKQFSDYCKKHPQAVEFVEQELPLCEEMVKLLPVKIMRMKQELGID